MHFITPVNEWGLPTPHIPQHGAEAVAIWGLCPKETTRWYWCLRGLNVSYRYNYRGITRQHSYYAPLILAMEERLLVRPEIRHFDNDGPYLQQCELDLADLRCCEDRGPKKGGYDLIVLEHDEDSSFCFASSPPIDKFVSAQYTLDASPFLITFYLGSEDPKSTGYIDWVSLQPQFYSGSGG